MAFSSQAMWQVINGGNDATTGNGGGFDPGGCTFDNTASVASANTSAPVVTITNYSFVAGDVGAWWYPSAGTGLIPGWYPIASVSGGSATLNAAIGAAQLLTKGLNTVVGCSASSSLSAISWTVDYSRSTTARYTFTDATTTGAVALFTSVANPPTVNMVANIISWSSGTNFTVQRVQILSVTASVATCDKNVTTGIGATGTGKLGAAFASIGMAGSVHVASNGIWVKYNATAFSSTSSTSNVTVGRLMLAVGTSTANSFIRGYDAVCGDETSNRPELKWGTAVNAASTPLITGVTSSKIENLVLNGNTGSATNTVGYNPSIHTVARKVLFKNFNKSAVVSASGGTNNDYSFIECEFTGNITTAVITIGSIIGGIFKGCSFHDNTINVITLTTGNIYLNKCNFYNNTGAAVNNVQITGAGSVWADNVTMGTVGQHGFDIQAALLSGTFTNTYVQGAGGWGWNFATAMDSVVMYNCGGYNNTSGNFDVTKLTNAYDQIGFLSPSADVFTNLAGGDLTLNNTAGAGALLRAAGWPSTYPGMTGTNYPDVGAYQHQDPASGGGGASYSAPRAVRN